MYGYVGLGKDTTKCCKFSFGKKWLLETKKRVLKESNPNVDNVDLEKDTTEYWVAKKKMTLFWNVWVIDVSLRKDTGKYWMVSVEKERDCGFDIYVWLVWALERTPLNGGSKNLKKLDEFGKTKG